MSCLLLYKYDLLSVDTAVQFKKYCNYNFPELQNSIGAIVFSFFNMGKGNPFEDHLKLGPKFHSCIIRITL